MAGLIHFQPSRSNLAPEIRNENIQSSATFTIGAPLQRDTVEDDVEEHAGGATVTGIIGVAMVGVASGVPAAKGGTAYGTTIPVAIAGQTVEFLGQLINSGTVQTPDDSNEGTQYGMIKVSNNWYVDEADTSDVVLTVTKVLPEIKAVLFKFLASAIAD